MHPGEVLHEEFLVLLKLSAGALARKMDVPRTRIERIAEEKTGITADTALRLSKAPRRSCGSTCKRITTCRSRILETKLHVQQFNKTVSAVHARRF
jgi:addiction module HigA family antidote